MSNNSVIRLDTPCARCGSYTYEFKYKKPHIGLYCKCCLSWIKWLSKKEKSEYNIVTPEDMQNNGKNAKFTFLDDTPFEDKVVQNIMNSIDDEELPWY